MLSPEQIEEAGERVAAVYREIEARMLDHLARAMAEGWGKSPRTVTETALLAQSQAGELRRMVEEFRPSIDAAVLEVVEGCLEASDEDDVARAGGSPMWPAQIDATVRGMAEVLARDNIQMAEGAKQAFLNASIEAVTRVNSGDADRESALHRAVRKLERDGIDVVTYQDASTGRVTVRNKADVAVRRHVRTQIVQDAQRMTMARMERLGIDLVEVSSHSDARESHAEWQGQCYSLKGEQVIDGVRYPDFYLAAIWATSWAASTAATATAPTATERPGCTSRIHSTPAASPARRCTSWSRGSGTESARYARRSASCAGRSFSTSATSRPRIWPST